MFLFQDLDDDFMIVSENKASVGSTSNVVDLATDTDGVTPSKRSSHDSVAYGSANKGKHVDVVVKKEKKWEYVFKNYEVVLV